MLTVYDSRHIPTNRHVKGHPACRSHTGIVTSSGEARRIHQEGRALVNRRLRFAWLVRQWNRHEERCRFMKERYR